MIVLLDLLDLATLSPPLILSDGVIVIPGSIRYAGSRFHLMLRGNPGVVPASFE
jgi:hypothetical protein